MSEKSALRRHTGQARSVVWLTRKPGSVSLSIGSAVQHTGWLHELAGEGNQSVRGTLLHAIRWIARCDSSNWRRTKVISRFLLLWFHDLIFALSRISDSSMVEDQYSLYKVPGRRNPNQIYDPTRWVSLCDKTCWSLRRIESSRSTSHSDPSYKPLQLHRSKLCSCDYRPTSACCASFGQLASAFSAERLQCWTGYSSCLSLRSCS